MNPFPLLFTKPSLALLINSIFARYFPLPVRFLFASCFRILIGLSIAAGIVLRTDAKSCNTPPATAHVIV